jgi:hypothetical protein
MSRHTEDENDPIELLREAVHEETAAAVEHTAQATARRSAGRWVPWMVAGSVLVSLLVSSSVAVAVYQLYGRQDQVAASVLEARRLAEIAADEGRAANEELARRGQPQVPIPDPKDGDVGTLVAAATAQVLATLPERPTAEQMAAAISQYVAARPGAFGPSPQQIGDAVASHLAANPPPPGETGRPGVDGVDGRPGADGEPGRDGVDGRTPTTEEIRAALADYLRDNPDVLCPRGGQFAQLRVQLSDGGTADTWQCVVAVQPPTAEPPTVDPLLPVPRR